MFYFDKNRPKFAAAAKKILLEVADKHPTFCPHLKDQADDLEEALYQLSFEVKLGKHLDAIPSDKMIDNELSRLRRSIENINKIANPSNASERHVRERLDQSWHASSEIDANGIPPSSCLRSVVELLPLVKKIQSRIGQSDDLVELENTVKTKTQITGVDLPDLFKDLFPKAPKGDHRNRSIIKGPLYTFVSLCSEALGLGKIKPEAVAKNIQRAKK